MKAIILGAGRIGRGFVTELMTLNNIQVTFFDAMPAMVESLNREKEYTIHVLGNPDLDLRKTDVVAYETSDTDKLAQCWQEADFVFTACGGKNLKSVGATLASAFKKMAAAGKLHVSNIVTCENWIDPAKDLKEGILENLSAQEAEEFEKYTGVSEAVILCTGTGAPDPSKVANPMDTWVQNLRYLPIDRDRIKGEIPKLEYVEFVPAFGDLLKQKIYTNNTSVATVAYLGRLLGKTYVAESANDPQIEPILDGVYAEINQALVKGLGINEESQLAFSKRAKAKYTDPDIIDVVTRIGRDPIRKLGPEDRFIGPMTIAINAGVEPKNIALGCAAALYFENPEDESAVELAKMRREKGIDYILENVSKLDLNGPVAKEIKAAVETLKQKGWIRE